MNIFILDNNPKYAAQYHCDQHIPKLILESVQILSTALNEILNTQVSPYKSAFIHHPCNIWTRESFQNYKWLISLLIHLNKEYKNRFNHSENHKSFDLFLNSLLFDIQVVKNIIPEKGLTEFAQAVPDKYKNRDAVIAYRQYYRREKLVFSKKGKIKWSNGTPWWWEYY